jgi:hypothetical protein
LLASSSALIQTDNPIDADTRGPETRVKRIQSQVPAQRSRDSFNHRWFCPEEVEVKTARQTFAEAYKAFFFYEKKAAAS